MKTIRCLIASSASALLTLLLPCSLLAQPIVVSINDVPNAQPVIHVLGAPNGYDINTVLPNNPTIEDGALITLFGVDNYFTTELPLDDWEGRFVIPAAPDPTRTAVDIVWLSHDYPEPYGPGPFGKGDLQVGFNSAFAGTYYRTVNSLGLVTDNWVTVYANDTLVVRYKPHTYLAKGYVPFTGAMELLAGPPSTPPEPIPDNPDAFVREYTGSGNASHLGEMQVWMKLTIYPDQASPYTDPRGYDDIAFPYAGDAVLTAANGDTVQCRVNGIEGLTIPPWRVEGSLQITGGTGRFQDTKGSLNFTGLDADIITAVLDGTISTVGSKK